MAQDSELPKAADKGKGKAVDDAKKDKPLANGKKEDDKVEGMGIQLHSWCDLLLTVPSCRGRAQRGGSATQERTGHDG